MSQLEERLLLQLKALKLPLPEREYYFAKPRRYRADFAWPRHRLLVECEGGQWIQGRHQRGTGFESDCEKYAEAIIRGWRVLRVTGNMIKDGRALALIERLLQG